MDENAESFYSFCELIFFSNKVIHLFAHYVFVSSHVQETGSFWDASRHWTDAAN